MPQAATVEHLTSFNLTVSQLLLQGGCIAKNQQSTSSSCQHHLMPRIARVKSMQAFLGKMVLVNLKQHLAYFHRLPTSQIAHLCCKHAMWALCPTGHNECLHQRWVGIPTFNLRQSAKKPTFPAQPIEICKVLLVSNRSILLDRCTIGTKAACSISSKSFH